MNENVLGLYSHNLESYSKIKKWLKTENIAAIVHATGTGKSYNALQISYDNLNKKILYIVPSNSIIEHLQNIIEENSLQKQLVNIEFKTYQSFVNMSEEEIKALNFDMLILDEFHHIGAPIWGSRINKVIETHPNIKILGMTAYTVRDRGTAYERDMVNPDKNELFSNKVVSRYDLVDAMIDGVLPKPIYKSAYVNLEQTLNEIDLILDRINHKSKEYSEYKKALIDARKRIHEAPSIKDLLKSTLKPDGKYIYFCPLYGEDGANDIDTIMAEAKNWMKEMGLCEEDFVFYKSTSDMGIEGKKNRLAFYNDETLDGSSATNKLQIMFAINQYNEGVHAPNIDGVIMGRGTCSDIVFFEQLGRALAVRGKNKEKLEELNRLSLEELKIICNQRNIIIKNATKEQIIEKLLSPVIIDLANNFEFIKQIQDQLKDRIKEIQTTGNSVRNRIELGNPIFDIELLNQDLFEVLLNLKEKIGNNWNLMYGLAKIYYNYFGNLNVNFRFKTINGYEYDTNGYALGAWILSQKSNEESLSAERKEKLNQIGMIWDNKYDLQWEEKYELAKVYYEHYGNLLIKYYFKTIDGYTYYENGITLGLWIRSQRRNKNKISEERKNKLNQIGMIWDVLEAQWEEMYELAKVYYEHYGNLHIKGYFKTINGYEYDKSGKTLGSWILIQREKQDKLSEERKNKLNQIGMIWDNKCDLQWEVLYELAKAYYEYHGNLNVKNDFKTINGYEYDSNGKVLGTWVYYQKINKNNLSEERKEKLEKIGIKWDNKYDLQWEEMYELAKIYYEYKGNLNVNFKFKTINGYEYDKNGYALGVWILSQKSKEASLSAERKEKLNQIGMIWNNKYDLQWEEMYKLAKAYYEFNGNLRINEYFKTINGYEYDENGKALGAWIRSQRKNQDKLSEERKNKLNQIGMIWGNKFDLQWEEMYKLAKAYYEHHGNLIIKNDFKTINGYEYDINGKTLGIWIEKQKRNRKKLLEERKEKLNQIGMIWGDVNEYRWQQMYELAQVYYEHHGNLNVKRVFKTINGYEYNSNGETLGLWIRTQRTQQESMSNERRKKLNQIGMIWGNKFDLQWEEMYKLAQVYYKHHGNLNVKRVFKTINGYEYDINGETLGLWIGTQRAQYESMSDERRKKLNQIGIIWDVKKNKNKIIELCKQYSINYDTNKEILKIISFMEFQIKIEYLIDNNIDITNNGKLHEIFRLSSISLKEKYGISLDELIMEYKEKNRVI